MAASNADPRLITGQRSWAPAGLWLISLVCFLYVGLLYMVASNPDVRAFGFGTIADVQQNSALIFVLLFFAALAVEHNAPEGRPSPPEGKPSGARPQGPSLPRRTGAQVSLKDPHARPGATPPMSIPRIHPDRLEGGWQRWKFPSERTGGIYIDTDVVVDDIAPDDSAEDGRGLHILRVRDEVARVCVRCDLISHCHGKVRTLITREEMLGNSECVSGLRQIAKAKIAARDAARAQSAAPPASDGAVGPGPTPEIAPPAGLAPPAEAPPAAPAETAGPGPVPDAPDKPAE